MPFEFTLLDALQALRCPVLDALAVFFDQAGAHGEIWIAFTAVLLAISFVCFVFINLIPSNPAEVVLRIQQTPIITDEAIAEMEEALGLNKPFLVRYFDWVLGCLQGDFGISYVNPARTVAGELDRKSVV